MNGANTVGEGRVGDPSLYTEQETATVSKDHDLGSATVVPPTPPGCKRNDDWDVYYTEAVGRDVEGEPYFFNKKTQETQWELPPTFFTELDERETRAASFTHEITAKAEAGSTDSSSLPDLVVRLGLESEEGKGELDAFLQSGDDGEGRCRTRLCGLQELIETIGTEDEWKSELLRNGSQLPQAVTA